MSGDGSRHKVIAVGNLQEFFRDALNAAMSHQKLSVRDHTEHYIVNLLTLFARTDALYETTPKGARLKPLVVMLAEALDAPTPAGAQSRVCNAWATCHCSLRVSLPAASPAS